MDPSPSADETSGSELDRLERELSAVAELGRLAARSARVQDFLEAAVRRVADVLEVDYSEMLELMPEGDSLRLRAGAGWKPGTVGQTIVLGGTESQAGYTLRSREPVIVEDLRTETRFHGPSLLVNHDVVSGLTCVIEGAQRPYGVLGAHARSRHRFHHHDVWFLQAIAGLIGLAVARERGAGRTTQKSYN